MQPTTLAQLCVYLVTDRTLTGDRSLTDSVEQALHGGVRAVQLRERDLETRALVALAQRLRALTRQHNALLLVNDRIDVALAVDADGVHLPAHSFNVADARRLIGPRRLIGVSTHRIDEVTAAASAGADFAVFGPVFATPSKDQYGAPVGIDAFAAAAASPIPVIAIGGVTAAHVQRLRASGAAGVAVIRAILADRDPAHAAALLRASFEQEPTGGAPVRY